MPVVRDEANSDATQSDRAAVCHPASILILVLVFVFDVLLSSPQVDLLGVAPQLGPVYARASCVGKSYHAVVKYSNYQDRINQPRRKAVFPSSDERVSLAV